uniref:Cytoplasmic intermediate filament protein n=1 Tax=Urechis caupo TaxID=6431 RepID=O97354_URECA|nr:cytoplasmic intermediate filament protein [Urechis caupo]
MSSQTKTKTTSVEGPSSTTKTTTTTYRTKSSNDGYSTTYRPMTTRRSAVSSRPAGGSMIQRSVNMSYNSMPMMSAGAYANVANLGITSVREGRDQEKKDMQDLNERLASYLEKVRFLEARNRKLADELDKLKSKWGKETTAVKTMYQTELDEARRLLDESEKGKAGLELQVTSQEEIIRELEDRLHDTEGELENQRMLVSRLNDQMSQLEGEINGLRRRNDTLEEEKKRDKAEIARLLSDNKRIRMDLDAESLALIDANNRCQTLGEEIEFMKAVHEQELKELSALICRDTTSENREFWKNEMGECLREIQDNYDQKLADLHTELESHYSTKLQEFRHGAAKQNMETTNAKEETKKFRSQLADLRHRIAELDGEKMRLESMLREQKSESDAIIRDLQDELAKYQKDLAACQAEMSAVMAEMQGLIDNKLSMELEIAAYRKLLEGEENRMGLSHVVSSMMSSSSSYDTSQMHEGDDDANLRISQVVKGEMSAKTTYQRSAKGPVSIQECASNGESITLENNGSRDENLSSWTIMRTVDGQERKCVLPRNATIPRRDKRTFICKGGERKSANDIECNIDSFGIGANITTKLTNPDGEEKASHVQRTQYQS